MKRSRECLAILSMLCMLVMLAACARATVIREPSHRGKPVARNNAARPNPPRTGAPSIVVRKGETLYRIATNNSVSPLDLAMWNRIPPPYTIYPGQRLQLSPPHFASTPSSSRPPAGTVPARPPMTPPVAGLPPKPANPNSSPPPTPPTPVDAGFAWRWPADGSIVGAYASGDPTRQGIDIGGQGGAPVRAAADGVVVYSGAGLVGYGELIIIKHNEQWLSAYGHNRARLVNEGQRVKSGEQIAEMGRSGAARDMLHFEVRYNGKPLDPQQYLPKR